MMQNVKNSAGCVISCSPVVETERRMVHGEMKLLKPSHSWLFGLPLIHAGPSRLYLETSMPDSCSLRLVRANASAIAQLEPTLFSKYIGIHYINYMLLVVPNTEAALLCWSAMDTV